MSFVLNDDFTKVYIVMRKTDGKIGQQVSRHKLANESL